MFSFKGSKNLNVDLIEKGNRKIIKSITLGTPNPYIFFES